VSTLVVESAVRDSWKVSKPRIGRQQEAGAEVLTALEPQQWNVESFVGNGEFCTGMAIFLNQVVGFRYRRSNDILDAWYATWHRARQPGEFAMSHADAAFQRIENCQCELRR